MTVYALIHGSHHGAWCWNFLRHELGARGHRAIAVDMPVDDPTAGLSEYVKVALDALVDVDDDPVVVGHSLGGLVAPVVAARRPVRRLVYLAAPIPEPGSSFADQQERAPTMATDGVRVWNSDGTWSRPGGGDPPLLPRLHR